MGATCSWAAVRGIAKGDLLAALDVVETDEVGRPWNATAPMSLAVGPDGWIILYSKDIAWSDRERVRALSRFGFAVGGQRDDGRRGETTLFAAEAGGDLWQVRAALLRNERSLLEVGGNPPVSLAAGFRQADERLGGEGEPWHGAICELPDVLAQSVCGFRLDDARQRFTGLRPAGDVPHALTGASFAWRESLLGSLFAPFLILLMVLAFIATALMRVLR